MQRLLVALLACLLLVAHRAGHARDMSGRLGVGGHLDTGPLGAGLSLKYWVSDLGLQGCIGLDSVHSAPGVVGRLEFRPGIRVLYAMTRTRLTNLYIGGGVTGVLGRGGKSAAASTGAAEPEPSGTVVQLTSRVFFDALIGAELFVGETFAVAGHVTFSAEIGDVRNQHFGSASWGASFHWYF